MTILAVTFTVVDVPYRGCWTQELVACERERPGCYLRCTGLNQMDDERSALAGSLFEQWQHA